MNSITINAAVDHQYTTEALDRAAMLIEDVLRGRAPQRIDDLSAATGKPWSMIRAAVARGLESGELAITPASRVALVRCKPVAVPTKTTKTTRTAKTRKPRKAPK